MSAISVQFVPFQDSVFAPNVLPGPPATIAAVCVPKPAQVLCSVFKSLTSVQLVPFHNSVCFLGESSPPKVKAAVLVPDYLVHFFQYLNRLLQSN